LYYKPEKHNFTKQTIFVMNTKLKPIAVEEYSKAFAKKLCTAFFEENELINGKQILSFTNVYQVNLFILYKLFDRWQQETAKLKSPYFNYTKPEVMQALTVFMNTLSQHISIRAEDFEPLVIRSVTDTLRLVITPYEFIKTQLTHHPVVKITRLREMNKYIHLNNLLFKEYTDKLESTFGEEMDWDQALPLWTEMFPALQHKADDPAPIIEIFSKRLPIFIEDLYENVKGPVIPPMQLETESIFDQVSLNRFVSAANNDAPQSIYNNLDFKIENEIKTNSETSKNGMSLYEQYKNGSSTLNDRFGENSADNFLKKQMKQKIENILNAISLNQKFIFTGDLFGGDANKFQYVVEELDKSSDLNEALSLTQKYSSQYNWEMESEPVHEFMDLVERRFL